MLPRQPSGSQPVTPALPQPLEAHDSPSPGLAVLIGWVVSWSFPGGSPQVCTVMPALWSILKSLALHPPGGGVGTAPKAREFRSGS